MRFILGLISGAVAVLMLAAALEVPTDRLLAQTVAYGQAARTLLADWQRPVPARAQTAAQTTAGTEPAAAAEEPIPTPDVPEPVPVVEAPTTGVTAEANTPVPYQSDEPAAGGEAAVWSPFHSEASASGFASLLARQLQHPFEVRREGPANYQVVYDYIDEQHRQMLQQQIARITGAPSL